MNKRTRARETDGQRNTTKLGVRTRTLSLAVQLVDIFSDGRPAGRPRVSIEGVNVAPIENRSGYLLFLDLDPDPASGPITVSVDGGEYYSDESLDVALSTLQRETPLSPAITIELTPSTAYKFPAGTTLLRGHVRDSEGTGVTGAKLSIRGLDCSTETERDGEFVLFIEDVSPSTVTKADGKRLVTVDSENPTIEVSHPTAGSNAEQVAIEEGKTTVTELICG